MKTILIVDDNDTNLMAAKTALEGVYKSYTLPSAQKMFKLLDKIFPDLILLDVDMPEMDGFEAIQALKADKRLQDIPVIFLTAKHDAASEIRGFEMGALDFINKPFSAPVLIRRIQTHIETDMLIKESQRTVHDFYNATLSVIADMVESRDKVTGGHIERTQHYLELLINELIHTKMYATEVASWDMSLLLPSAQLHDVGKITISDTVLNKPGKLTNEEFDIIKTHCMEGEQLIDKIISKTDNGIFLEYAKRFAGYHHEKWDGSGYPRGLAGADIPLEGRLMAVADVYDALVSERPYKKAFSHEEAVEIITKSSGTHFDPDIVRIFLNVASEFAASLIAK
ncbi:MAG: response regulator [Deferribacteraceae bacterium]|jgi:putative two-component system response regulator|nr:response regulator [Deferribacteraceae bacterium]